MTADAWNAVAQWVIAGIALIAAAIAVRQARGANRDATQAHKIADESRLAFERIADALEAQRVGADVPPVSFSLERRGRDSYTLRNLGPKPATNVRLDPLPAGVLTHGLDGEPMSLPPMQGQRLLIAPTFGSGLIDEITVRCDEIAGPIIMPLPG